MTATETKEAPETGPKPGEAQSYWSLASRDFRRNKLAMAALGLIFFVVTLAVHVPLLASHLPLYIHGVMKDDFENEMFLVQEAITTLVRETGKDEGKAKKALAELEVRRVSMRDHMLAADATALDGIVDRVKAGLSPEFKVDLVTAAGADFDARFYDKTPELVSQEKYPALRGLSRQEIWFMGVYWFTLLGLLLPRKLLRGLFPFVLFVVIPSTIIAYGARTVWPDLTDTLNYRKLTNSPDFKGSVVHTLVPFGENENILKHSRKGPSYSLPTIGEGNEAEPNPHLLGTDTNGRDVLSRMMYGSRVAMLIGIFAVGLYTSIGIVIGACAGYFRGWVDLIVSRVIEVVICFPFLMVILSVQAFLTPNIRNIILTLGVLSWTTVARLQRGEFLRLVNLDFVNAVRALGGSDLRIIFLHVLPNAMGPILVLVSFGIAGSILTESALSFLGFGVPQPTASWGDLLNNSRSDPQGLWWLTLFPGVAIFLTVTCFNLIGEGIRDALDPRRDR